MRAHFSFWLLIGILLIGGFLRFYQIKEIPLGLYPDEAMNGSNALEALATGRFKVFYPENNGREGLFINIQAFSVWLFGNEAWALRVVSAAIGTLTILGVYLAGKELFYKNSKSETLNPKQSQNSNAPNTKRRFDALDFGYLNLFRVWDLGFGISRGEIIGLLSSFFLATSYWHLNFSRIGFRAITLPFFAAFAMYFLLKGLRRGKTFDLVWAGIFMGLGFHGYIAFRFVPFVAAVPIIVYLWQYYGSARNNQSALSAKSYQLKAISCTPCAAALFLFVTFVVALPIGVYFLQNPQDFIGRSGQVSVFSSSTPIKGFLIANAKTIGMFFWKGDCNWRHNYNCQPELNPIVGIFFLIGSFLAVGSVLRLAIKSQIPNPKSQTISNDQNPKSKTVLNFDIGTWNLFEIWNLRFGILLAWLFFMSLPATFTTEGLPHALRAIGMILPVMILAAAGVYQIGEWIKRWSKKQEERRPLYRMQLQRITRELFAALGLLVLLAAPMTFRAYFNRWAYHEQTYDAFSVSFAHIAEYLNRLPRDIHAYVLVNMGGTEVRGIPMPAQTVMFLTDTFRQENRARKGVSYVAKLEDIPQPGKERMIVIPMNGHDTAAIASLKTRFPDFAFHAPSDFLVFEKR